MRNKIVSMAAYKRAEIALNCAIELMPHASPKRQKEIASKILRLVWDEKKGYATPVDTFTQQQAEELIAPFFFCHASYCAGLWSWEQISRAIRIFFGSKERG